MYAAKRYHMICQRWHELSLSILNTVSSRYIAVLFWKDSRKTPHSSPVRARYGVRECKIWAKFYQCHCCMGFMQYRAVYDRDISRVYNNWFSIQTVYFYWKRAILILLHTTTTSITPTPVKCHVIPCLTVKCNKVSKPSDGVLKLLLSLWKLAGVSVDACFKPCLNKVVK